MTTLSYACLLLATFVFVETNALQCHKCNQATHPSSCNLTITCQSSETCYTNAYHDGQVVKYTMGCIDHHMCSQLSASSMPHVVGKRQLECHKCCSRDECNIDLCSQLESGTCVDDEQEDCAKLDSLVQICQDIPHARLICPRYCNLCNITDGGWSTWSCWTDCSVTCENGYRTRNRLCNNPTPSSLGEQCKGSSYDRMNCSLQTCPVHGGWTTWSSWGACSVSCDIGIQTRDRSCANPYPRSGGDFCYGDSRDDRICSVKPCADGNWSVWSSWSVCSLTCGTGLQTRQRQCDNPKPSLLGSYCAGNPFEVSTCFLKACHDGGWSVWGAWSTCSLTCGGGIHSRSRTCSNPAPSEQGLYCSGNSFEEETCNGDKCPEKMVPQIIFQARTLDDLTLETNQTLIFTNVMQNLGNGYNSTTGHFTAPISGAYFFTFQYCVFYGQHFFYAIVVDNVIHTSGHAYDGNQFTCATADALMILKAGQSVWVKVTSRSPLFEQTKPGQYLWNIFSGILLHE